MRSILGQLFPYDLFGLDQNLVLIPWDNSLIFLSTHILTNHFIADWFLLIELLAPKTGVLQVCIWQEGLSARLLGSPVNGVSVPYT